MGFRVAHATALNERCSRVVIVTYGDIEYFKNVDTELKAYFNSNIFLRWEDQRFFDKLRFALAHPNYFKTKSNIQ